MFAARRSAHKMGSFFKVFVKVAEGVLSASLVSCAHDMSCWSIIFFWQAKLLLLKILALLTMKKYNISE
jgi:hypothetical protein